METEPVLPTAESMYQQLLNLQHQIGMQTTRLDEQTSQLHQQSSQIIDQQNMISSLQKKLKSQQNLRSQEPTQIQLAPIEQLREKLPLLKTFTGNRSFWDEWHLGAVHKLTKDGHAIGDDFDQFMYIYSRLEGDAVKMVSTTAKLLSEQRTGNGLEFLSYLHSIYGDQNKVARARQQLYNLKQGDNEPFSLFLPRFETILANAGWASYDDSQRVSLLQNSLCKRLRIAMAGKKQRGWSEYVSKVQRLSSDLTNIKFIIDEKSRTDNNFQTEIDWEPLQASTASTKGRKRASWVEKEILAFRKKHGFCMRCGNKGHKAPKCSFLPPLPPSTKINSTEVTEEEEEIQKMAQPDRVIENEQGKEMLL